MKEERISEIIKMLFGRNYFIEKNPNGDGIYKVKHTIGLNGAVGSAYGYVYTNENSLRFMNVWKKDAEPIADKARALGFEVTMDYHVGWWVVMVYDKNKNMSKYEKLYDEIISVCAKTTEFCGENIFESDDEAEIARYRKLRDAVENLHDVAHELEEHLAWD